MMIRLMLLICTFLFFLFTSLSFASDFNNLNYYPTKYKKLFHGENFYITKSLGKENIRQILHDILDRMHIRRAGLDDKLAESCDRKPSNCYQQIDLGYLKARKFLFGQIHLQSDDDGQYVYGVYCDRKFRNEDFATKRGIGKNKIPDGTILNTEHTWPQSRFTTRYPKGLQKSDLHHLFPTDSKANGIRGNSPFAEVNGRSAYDNCQASKIGIPLNGGTIISYEPPDYHKGNVARALFYFAVRYELSIDPIQEYYFRKWHKEDPVDAAERKRNEKIYKIQGNRNPFIDFPDLVEKISNF